MVKILPRPWKRWFFLFIQMICGIQASGDVKLSEIARSLHEQIALLKTESRLSRNLAEEGLEESLRTEYCEEGRTARAQGHALAY